jgi:hypothetical protein
MLAVASMRWGTVGLGNVSQPGMDWTELMKNKPKIENNRRN